MYFWKVDKLIDDLKLNKVTQKEEFKYALTFFVFSILCTDPFLYANTSYNIYNSINTILFISVTTLGLYYCFKINAAGDNQDFIKRILCIGIPIMVRLFVIFTPISLALSLFVYFLIQDNSMGTPIPEIHEQNIFELIYMVLLECTYFGYLAIKMKKISNA